MMQQMLNSLPNNNNKNHKEHALRTSYTISTHKYMKMYKCTVLQYENAMSTYGKM